MAGSTPFFRVGGTLDPGAPSYLERRADRALLATLLRQEYVFLLDSRQKGKSSLVARAIVGLRAANVSTVRLDLQHIGANVSVEQWYAGLLSMVGKELGLSDSLFAYWAQNQSVGPLARWIGAWQDVILPSVQGPIVVFIDEIDFVQALPFSTDEFFAGIRDCYNRRSDRTNFERLTFCLVGVATPSQLVRNPEITPFNVGTRIEIGDFDRADLEPFEQGFQIEGSRAKAILERIFYWVAGHPYLTQLLCSEVQNLLQSRGDADVDEIVGEVLIAPSGRIQDSNIADVERRVLEPDLPHLGQEEARTQLLLLYQRLLTGGSVPYKRDDPVSNVLLLSGIASSSSGELHVRNRVYKSVFDQKWVDANLPGAEVRRMRAAARRAALRVGSVAIALVAAAISVSVYTNGLANAARRNQAAAEYEAYCSALTIMSQHADDGHWQGIVDTVAKLKDSPYVGWEYRYWQNQARENGLADDDGRTFDWRWTRDGKSIISRHPSGIRFLDPVTGKVTRVLKARPVDDMAAAFEVAGGNILDLHWTGDSTLYSPEGEPIWTKHVGQVHWRPDAIVSPDGTMVTGNQADALWVLDTLTGDVRTFKEEGLKPWRGVFGSRGKLLAAVCQPPSPFPSGYPGRLRFDADVLLLDPHSLSVKQRVRVGNAPQSVTLDEHNGLLYVGLALGDLEIYELSTGKLTQTLPTGTDRVWRMCLSRDTSLLSVANLDGSMNVFRRTGRTFKRARRTEGIVDLKWNADASMALASYSSARVVSTSALFETPGRVEHMGRTVLDVGRSQVHVNAMDGRMLTYDLSRNAQVVRNEDLSNELTGPIASLERERMGEDLIVLSDARGRVSRYDPATGSLFDALLLDSPHEIALLSDNSKDGVALERTTQSLHKVRNGEVVEWDHPLNGQVTGISISPDRKLVLATTTRGALLQWDTATDVEILNTDSVPFCTNGVAFDMKRDRLYLATDHGEILVMDLKMRLLERGGRHAGTATCIALSPDGSRLATGGDDNTVRIWDANTARLLTVLRGHTDMVDQIGWMDGGDTVVSIAVNGEVLWWRSKPREGATTPTSARNGV